MRIFIAGATGVLGRNLIPKLLNHGHSVIGTSSTKARLRELQQLGADAVLMNGIDRDWGQQLSRPLPRMLLSTK